MKTIVAVCPHCGNRNTVNVNFDSDKILIRCDIDDSPGCDSLFVVIFHFEPVVKTYKIEGVK